MENDQITVVVAEDHAMVRDLLQARLSAEDDISVLALAGTAEEALEHVFQFHPDVVLLDIEMPGLSSFEAARTIKVAVPEAKIIFVTAFVSDRYIEQALELEGSGYVTKYEEPESIVNAIRTVMGGGVYFSPEVQNRICLDRSGARLNCTTCTRLDLLTRRERTVLECVARGLSNKEIADELHISGRTVEHHCTHIMAKLDLHDRVQLTRFAIREGLVSA